MKTADFNFIFSRVFDAAEVLADQVDDLEPNSTLQAFLNLCEVLEKMQELRGENPKKIFPYSQKAALKIINER